MDLTYIVEPASGHTHSLILPPIISQRHSTTRTRRVTSRHLQDFEEETRKVKPSNIILEGLSQGCAMGLICLLALDTPVGGFIGMGGWMPFRQEIEDLLQPNVAQDLGDNPFTLEEDIFDRTSEDKSEASQSYPAARVVKYAQDLVSSERETRNASHSVTATPVFLGHGAADEKINQSLGKEACRVMESTGFPVEWRSYSEQYRWYKIPEKSTMLWRSLKPEPSGRCNRHSELKEASLIRRLLTGQLH